MTSTLPSLDYIAGFIDGEGCFSITYSHGSDIGTLTLHITNTELSILRAIQATFMSWGITSCHLVIQTKGTDVHKTGYALQLRVRDDLKLLCSILEPALYIKQRQCQIFKEYIAAREMEGRSGNHLEDTRSLLWLELKTLNRKGP